MTQTLVVTALTSCKVSHDGEAICLSVCDGTGAPLDLHLSSEQAGSLAMTLPRLLSVALKARYGDPSLRMVFPLTEYGLEGADGTGDRILSLKTSDGFEVSFSVSQSTLSQIGKLIGTDADEARKRLAMH